MSHLVKRGSGWILGLLVGLALAFGAVKAMATPVQFTCKDDGLTFLGSCTSQAECQAKCDAVHQPPGC